MERESTVVIGPLTIDKLRGIVYFESRRVHLTPTEFAMLRTLATSPGKVFRREELLKEVWGEIYVAVRTVDAHMAKLRSKLQPSKDGLSLAETVWGVGYRLRDTSS